MSLVKSGENPRVKVASQKYVKDVKSVKTQDEEQEMPDSYIENDGFYEENSEFEFSGDFLDYGENLRKKKAPRDQNNRKREKNIVDQKWPNNPVKNDESFAVTGWQKLLREIDKEINEKTTQILYHMVQKTFVKNMETLLKKDVKQSQSLLQEYYKKHYVPPHPDGGYKMSYHTFLWRFSNYCQDEAKLRFNVNSEKIEASLLQILTQSKEYYERYFPQITQEYRTSIRFKHHVDKFPQQRRLLYTHLTLSDYILAEQQIVTALRMLYSVLNYPQTRYKAYRNSIWWTENFSLFSNCLNTLPKSHKRARELILKDCQMIYDFFLKKGVKEYDSPKSIYNYICKPTKTKISPYQI